MAIRLHDATVATFQQHLGALAGLLDRAGAAGDEAALIEARLAEDMLPFGYQVKSVVAHSLGAIEGVRRGSFSPDLTPWALTLAELGAMVAEARAALAAVTADEVEGFIGRDMMFVYGERRLPFMAENFLLSFSIPNFFFHLTASYAILRARGVALSKRDFLGRLRLQA